MAQKIANVLGGDRRTEQRHRTRVAKGMRASLPRGPDAGCLEAISDRGVQRRARSKGAVWRSTPDENLSIAHCRSALAEVLDDRVADANQ
jgi:hypothetical protein